MEAEFNNILEANPPPPPPHPTRQNVPPFAPFLLKIWYFIHNCISLSLHCLKPCLKRKNRQDFASKRNKRGFYVEFSTLSIFHTSPQFCSKIALKYNISSGSPPPSPKVNSNRIPAFRRLPTIFATMYLSKFRDSQFQKLRDGRLSKEVCNYSYVCIAGVRNTFRNGCSLTHSCLVSHGKQCRPRSDAAERGVWSGSTLYALNTGISLKHGINKN